MIPCVLFSPSSSGHLLTAIQARGKEALRGPAYHQRLLPAHTQLKFRQPGQGGDADHQVRDLRAELLAAEAAHFSKTRGGAGAPTAADADVDEEPAAGGVKRALEAASQAGDEEDPEAKRRRILEEFRDVDADSDGADSDADSDDKDDEDDEDDDDSDDSAAELQREMERVRRERVERREREERERAAAEEEDRERDIALGNPLLNKTDFNIKRRWDDDVVFKNQARGTEDKNKKPEFVNVSFLPWQFSATCAVRLGGGR